MTSIQTNASWAPVREELLSGKKAVKKVLEMLTPMMTHFSLVNLEEGPEKDTVLAHLKKVWLPACMLYNVYIVDFETFSTTAKDLPDELVEWIALTRDLLKDLAAILNASKPFVGLSLDLLSGQALTDKLDKARRARRAEELDASL